MAIYSTRNITHIYLHIDTPQRTTTEKREKSKNRKIKIKGVIYLLFVLIIDNEFHILFRMIIIHMFINNYFKLKFKTRKLKIQMKIRVYESLITTKLQWID